MKYNFVTFIPLKTWLSAPHITITKKGVYVSAAAKRMLMPTERVELSYDLENRAICLKPSKIGYKLTDTPSGFALGMSFTRIMPYGVYNHIKENIYVYQKGSKGKREKLE